MKSKKVVWPLASIFGIRERINTNPDFQRPAVWGNAQKQLLIDTVLRNYDIPKFYWRQVGTKPDLYEVVDGQQRLRAVWSFMNGEFRLPKNASPIEGEEVAGLSYDELPDELRRQFDIYPLDVIVIEAPDEDEIREMFLRLQNGTTLKAQEKRNAMPGKMRDFARSVGKHEFFTRVGFEDSRFTYDLVAAQLIRLELAGEPVNIKDADLNKLYLNNADFDSTSAPAKSVLRKLGVLAKIFSEPTPELARFNVIALYCLLTDLQKNFVFAQVENGFHDWFIDFEKQRRAEDEKDDDVADAEWRSYKEKISHSTDAAESISHRTNFLAQNLLAKFPDLARKDNERMFTHDQRLTIFRRDKGFCQLRLKCDGRKLTWNDDWHADHRIAWSKGGRTTIENGQLACSACNLAKSDS